MMSTTPRNRKSPAAEGGKLKIGDDWNAIRSIALSQSNPLKAIAEFVENSIDAHAKAIVTTRGRSRRGASFSPLLAASAVRASRTSA
jgi:hypothetical protein